MVTNDKDFLEDGHLHRDPKAEVPGSEMSGKRIRVANSLESSIKHLDELFNVQALLEGEEWASISQSELKEFVPIQEFLEEQREVISGELEVDLLSEDPTAAYSDLYLPWMVEPHEIVFEAEYRGDGLWRLEGRADWETEVEYFEHDQRRETSECMMIGIEFVIYYNYRLKNPEEVIITGAVRVDHPEYDL